MSRYCDFGFCGELSTKYLLNLEEISGGTVLEACDYHGDLAVDGGLYREISEVAYEAIKAGFPYEKLIRTCDEEGCGKDGEVWVLWGLDDEDDDETVGFLCRHHATEVTGRGHADIIDEDEAIEIMTEAPEDAWKKLWDSIGSWGDTYVEDLALEEDELGF